jgi:hypothetical protein
VNEEALAHWGLLRQKQTNTNSVGYGVSVKCKVRRTYNKDTITYFMVKCYNSSVGTEKTYETVCFLDESRSGAFQVKSRKANHFTVRL